MSPSILAMQTNRDLAQVRDRMKSNLAQFNMAARIIRFVCDEFNVTAEDLESPGRSNAHVVPRWVAIYFIDHYTALSPGKIGLLFERDRGAINYALRSVEARIEIEPKFAKQVADLRERLLI
jgi:chromosomal replication initiator protein